MASINSEIYLSVNLKFIHYATKENKFFLQTL